MTVYEWSLCVARINKLNKDKTTDRELLMELERNSMALLANIHRDPKKHAPFSGKNFYTLSYDEVVAETKRITGEEALPLMIERFKNRPFRRKQ